MLDGQMKKVLKKTIFTTRSLFYDDANHGFTTTPRYDQAAGCSFGRTTLYI
jgi:hypothetical protein